jgi:alpha-glucosidase (family GH31 glycosyl hydrolase)
MLDYLNLDFQPRAHPEAIVQVGPVRFTVLTSRLIRLEYDPKEIFEDRPSQVFWYRQQPLPEFKKIVDSDKIIIETSHLRLSFDIQNIVFYHRYLQITLKENGFTWRYGQENHTNLGGTIRTLDRMHGPGPLDPGLISRTGWALVDDSKSLVFTQDGWLEPRHANPETKDLYFFGYGKDFTSCIRDFQSLSGKVPIIPRFALGNWWSRYWEYHQDDLIDLMHDFKAHHIPLSVCIVDMDWHIVDTGNESSGWTGYSWNPDLFPQPQKFFEAVEDLGVKTSLNLHPALGVYPHESQYPEMAKHMGIDPKSKQPIPFDIADRQFTQAYFEVLHHPLEVMGVDFWWIDWQQGTKTKIEGLDPLFWLNHLHFYDLARDEKVRPFIFSRWGGLSGHRYPIGFSGDSYSTWEMLQFQPHFTATAANVAYGWWSHDIGGHMGGCDDPELYLRWVQYGVFSPILRLHSTKNPYLERRPWGFDAETEKHASKAFRLRHAFIPYLYTAAWKNYNEGIVLVRPMYHIYPDLNDAYICPNEYAFGSELMAAPFTSPQDEHTRLSRQVVWFPEGDWYDFFTGDAYTGPGWQAIYGGLDKIPVFAKAGAIVPLGPITDWGGIDNPDTLILHIFPGEDNIYQLYEDDGETLAYEKGDFALTEFTQTWRNDQTRFEIHPTQGNTGFLSENRIYRLVFHALNMPETISISIDGKESQCEWSYTKQDHLLTIKDLIIPIKADLTVEIRGSGDLSFRADHRQKMILKMLKSFKMDTEVKRDFNNKLDEFMSDPTLLVNFADRMQESHLLALIEIWLGKQEQKIAEDPSEAFQHIINTLYSK